MKKFFAVIALTGMMVAVSAPAVLAANGKNVITLGIDDKEKKEKKKKSKSKSCCASGEAKSCSKADGKSCAKPEGKAATKSCCKGHGEAKTTENK